MVSRILIATVPARGHLFPTLAVAAELVARGHEVSYVTTGEFISTVTAAGVKALSYDSVDPVSKVGTDEEALAFPEENRRIVEAARTHFADAPPSVVLYDSPFNLAGRILARTWGIGGVELTPVFASNESYSFMQASIAAAGPPDTPPDTASFEEYGRRAAELLAEHGIDTPPHENPIGDAELSVVYVPRAFQPAGETFDERVAFVGPCLGERAFLGDWAPPTDGLPVVLASLGTTYNDNPDFFRTCAEAFAGLPWHLVLSVGQKVDVAALGPLPPNVEVRPWVPHLKVLEHATVFVTHGGMGSVLEALYHGCPMVFVPAWPDVQVIAERAAELGLGRLLPPAELTAERLRDAVLAVAADEATRQRVLDMRTATRESGGARRAADEVETHIERFGRTAS